MNRYTYRTGLLEAGLILAAAVFLIPIYVLVVLSLKTPEQISKTPLSLPTTPELSNYVTAWTEASLGPAMVTSVLITAVSVALTVILSALAAYPLARSTSRWNRYVFYAFMAGLLLPLQLGSIPLYQTFRALHLVGSPVALVVIYVATSMPFAIFLFAAFIRAFPVDYEEAALVDGCNSLKAFWYVVFPSLRAITGTVAILTAIAVWNDFVTPLLYLSGSERTTVPLAVNTFVGQFGTQWQLICAGIVIGMAPILLVYFAMQKRIIAGFSGGLKG